MKHHQFAEVGLHHVAEEAHFDENHVLEELKHFLPTQTPLKDFIHHNTLHAFQDLKFFDAIFKASKVFGFKVTFNLEEYRALYHTGRIKEAVLDRVIAESKGAHAVPAWKQLVLEQPYNEQVTPRIGQLRAAWKTACHVDLDNLVQPLLFRILGSYLDQGVALWHFPFEDKGLLSAVRALEQQSFTSFFKSSRVRNLLLNPSQCSIPKLLKRVVGDPAFYTQYLFDQQFSHRGWSGMAAALEAQPNSMLYPKKIELRDLIVLDLLLEMDALDTYLGENWQPLCSKIAAQPMDLFAEVETTEFPDKIEI